MKQDGCELCETDGGQLIISNERLRVVLVDDPALRCSRSRPRCATCSRRPR
jgi:hypothetical protein